MTRTSPDSSAAQHAAWALCHELGITEPEQIRLEDIAMLRGVFVKETDLSGAEARLVCRGNRGIVRVRRDLPEIGRKRFAIAHEIGHWEMHRSSAALSLCTMEDIVGYNGSPPEIEANVFAGSLLMPTKMMADRCRESEPDLDLIRLLSQEFTTTMTATAVRFVEISRKMCIAVFSENERVKWWRRSDSADYWIESGYPIDVRSNATIKSGQTDKERVEPDAWFPNLPPWKNIDLYEQSIALGHYGTVLTLLWIVDVSGIEEDDEDSWSRTVGSTIPSWKRRREEE